MNKKIVFISDFFASQISGGAEIYDEVLMKELTSKGVHVSKFNSHEFTRKHLNLYIKCGFNFIISNFVHLPQPVKKMFQLYPDRYCIIEHDHKYVAERNPALYKDFKAPKQRIVNRDFYKAAKYVFCQSNKHTEVLSGNLEIDKAIILGCALWSEEQL